MSPYPLKKNQGWCHLTPLPTDGTQLGRILSKVVILSYICNDKIKKIVPLCVLVMNSLWRNPTLENCLIKSWSLLRSTYIVVNELQQHKLTVFTNLFTIYLFEKKTLFFWKSDMIFNMPIFFLPHLLVIGLFEKGLRGFNIGWS